MSNTAEKNLDRLKQGFLFWNKHRGDQEHPDSKLDLTNLLIEGVHWKFNELKNANLSNCQFINTNFQDIDFLDIDFSNSDFSNASFKNVHFANCDFSGTSFKKVVFEETAWFHSNLSNFQFSDLSRIENIHFYKCIFQKGAIEALGLPEEIFEKCQFST